MPQLSREQQKIVAQINREASKVPKTLRRKFKLSAIETGLVESGLRNLNYGDADSKGWRQERSSLYKDPTNVGASVARYRQEFLQQYDPGETAGEVAAQVQRPAAQYRGRYRAVKPQARQILQQYGGGGGGVPGYRTVTSTTPGVDNSDARQQLQLSYLQNRGNPNALLDLAAGLKGAQDVAPTTSSARVQIPGAATSSQVDKAISAARKSLGIKEVGAANRGPQVDEIEQNFGMEGEAWCGLFAGTILQKAGVKGLTPRIASTAAIQEDAQAGKGPFKGFSQGTARARKGDLLLVREGGPNGHVEVITRVDPNGTVHTIGGNVGNAVRRGKYAPGEAFGVAHVRYRKK